MASLWQAVRKHLKWQLYMSLISTVQILTKSLVIISIRGVIIHNNILHVLAARMIHMP